MPRLIEIGPLVLLKILNFVNVCRFFVIIFTWKKKRKKKVTNRRTDRRTTDSRRLEKAQVSRLKKLLTVAFGIGVVFKSIKVMKKQ